MPDVNHWLGTYIFPVPYYTKLAARRPAILPSMKTPQAGIFALGTASHAYLEFDLSDQRHGGNLVAVISALREPRTTIGGVNLVAGFRPELWTKVAPDHAPSGVHGFNTQIAGKDRFVMPATQHDALLWISGSAYDVVFDVARSGLGAVKDFAFVAEETSSWPYRHDRDLTGFIDGSENPSLIDASDAALIAEGNLGGRWIHPLAAKMEARHGSLGVPSRPISKSKLWGEEKLTALSWTTSLTSRTLPERIRMSTARSSVATCHTELLPITERCL